MLFALTVLEACATHRAAVHPFALAAPAVVPHADKPEDGKRSYALANTPMAASVPTALPPMEVPGAPLTAGASITGALTSADRADEYPLVLLAGQTVTIEAQGVAMRGIRTEVLHQGRPLAGAGDEARERSECRLIFRARAQGIYIVRISAHARAAYTLSITEGAHPGTI